MFLKIYKEGMFGCFIVSVIGYFMEKIFEFIDLYFCLYVEDLLLYFKDIIDYLNKIFFFGLLDYIFFVIMDVMFLYMNIFYDEGIEVCREVWDSRMI